MGNVLTAVKNAVWPRRCPACHNAVRPFGAVICDGCSEKFSYIEGQTCRICGKELADPAQEVCAGCRRVKNGLAGGAALFHYEGTARDSMAKFKYEGRCEYADFYARELAARRGEEIRSFRVQALIPVPVHKSRFRERGYNQAEEIALRLGRILGIPVRSELLVRGRRTEAQKELGAAARGQNLSGAFSVSGRADGLSRVLLVDDIFTTGTTMQQCACALKEAGIEEVYGCSVCISEDY